MKSYNTMVVALVLATLSGASGFSTNRFLGHPESLQHAKEDAMHMWAVADMEFLEAKNEGLEARNGLADGKAIEKVAADAATVEEAQAKKELKGKDLDAALAVAQDEEAKKVKDAKQIEEIAAKEEKDAEDTRKEGAQVRQDATAIETAVMPARKVENEVDNEKADAEQMRSVADIEEREAMEERVKARNDMTNGKAVEKAAATTEKSDEARAEKELSTKNDRAAAVAVAQDEKNREDRDAKQMEDIATKEATDAENTLKDATRMRKDAVAIEAVVKVESEVGDEKADAEQMRIVADIEEREAVEERVKARDGMANSKAIETAAATTEKGDEARAAKELSIMNDRDAAVAVAQDEKNREDRDAKQMEDIATKEATDAADTMKDAIRMRKDAAAIEAVVD